MTRTPSIVVLASLLLLPIRPLLAQSSTESPYSRKNTFGFFGEYSNDSSHILIGQAENRKLAAFGFAYERRLHSFQSVEMHYIGELQPVFFESDPLVHQISYLSTLPGSSSYAFDFTQSAACKAETTRVTYPPSPGYPGGTVTYVDTCRRQWTFGQALSPLGLKSCSYPGGPFSRYSPFWPAIYSQPSRFPSLQPGTSTTASSSALGLSSFDPGSLPAGF